MRSPVTNQKPIKLTCPKLPLGVYREVAAHLRQVDGVDANVLMRSIEHDKSQKFDYYQSQAAALTIEYKTEISKNHSQQVESILDYYAQRYGTWKEYSDINTDSIHEL